MPLTFSVINFISVLGIFMAMSDVPRTGVLYVCCAVGPVNSSPTRINNFLTILH